MILPLPIPVAIVAQADKPGVEVWHLDQVRIDPGTDPKVLKAIAPLHSIDAVIALLRRRDIMFEHANAALLPDRLPAKIREQILALPKGEPFVLPEGEFISISVLVQRELPDGAVHWRPASHPAFSYPARKA